MSITNPNNTNNTSNSTTSPRVGPGGSTASKACAACKYQRRKCATNCVLAPYFPADQQKQFLNVHRLFGVSNVVKVLNNLQPFEKEIAVKSMIFQANVRAADPIGGCYRIIGELQRQIDHGKAELELVLHRLAICRSQAQVQELQINMTAATKVHGKSPYNPMHQYNFQTMDYQDNYYVQGFNVEESIGAIKIDTEGDLSIVHEEYEDIKPVTFDSKQSIHSSEKVVMKEDIESVQQKQVHDLKGAASLFSLTNSSG